MRLFLKSIVFLCILAILGFSACGGAPQRKLHPAGEGRSGSPKVNLEAPSDIQKKPWELWGLGRDLNGVSIHNDEIRRGDEYVSQGDYAAAFRIYDAIPVSSLSLDDQRSLIARKAGAQLAYGRYGDGLDTVSRFFTQQGKGADLVDGYFAVILGYGYGALGDTDQSLAWFARADGTVSNGPIFSNAAEHGARLLAQSIPAGAFDTAYSKWKDDLHFGNIFQQERALRSSPEYHPSGASLGGGAFWNQNVANNQIAVPLTGDTTRLQSLAIGVVLPLSGSFAPLGQGTKNGMDIALEAEQESRIQVVYKDSQGDVSIAQKAAEDLVHSDKASAIIGPLLSEPANVVRRVALQSHVAQISLSKANVFETGDNIFRLGATSNSQMDTLLDACSEKLGMTKFALVYPETNIGLEYANAFKKYISAKGFELLYEGTYTAQDPGKLSLIAAEVEKLNVQGIFVPDSLDQARNFFALLPESYRDRVRPLGPATWDDPQALSQSQAVFKGAVFVSPFFLGSTNPLVGHFVEKYLQKFGKRPDFLAAQGFDAMTIAIGAARKTLSDGTPFELALKDVEQYDGVTGSMRVDIGGEIQRAYVVVEARSGELRALGSEVQIGKEKQEKAISPTQSSPVQ